MTAATDPGRVVAWQWRTNLPMIGWTDWCNGGHGNAPLAHSTEYNEREHRALVPESLLAEAERERDEWERRACEGGAESYRTAAVLAIEKRDEAEAKIDALQAQVDAVRALAERLNKRDLHIPDPGNVLSLLDFVATEIRTSIGDER